MARVFQIIVCGVPWVRAGLSGCLKRARLVRRARLSALLFLFCLCLFTTLAMSAGNASASKPKKPPRAVLKISGYGFLGNRELKRILTTLELSGRKPEFFYPSFIEDAALILSARVKRDGFLAPKINIHLELENGTTVQT